MFAPVFARIPGSLFFQALKDGEPMAFVMLAAVIGLVLVVSMVKYLSAKSMSGA